MGKLFKREARVSVGALEVEGLRVQFKVSKSLQREPNKLELSIWNLSQDTRGKLTEAVEKRSAPVVIEAGYAGTATAPATTEVVFKGDARIISHVRQGPDWVTRLQSGDGAVAYKSARMVGSFAPGTKRATVIEEAAKSLGLPLGNLKERIKAHDFKGALTEFVGGFATASKASEQLTELLAPLGLGWSIQDGQIQVLGEKDATSAQAVVLAPDSGLVGSPELGEQGVLKVKSLLQPGLRPGRRVELDAETAKGLYRIERVTHVGDTHGTEWFSEAEVKPLGRAA